MEWIISNWYVVLGIVALLLCCVSAILYFIKLPTPQKIDTVKEWLKYAVAEAEKEMGSGTGQLKLHYVYDLAIKQFPWIAELISFATFSMWVDEALLWLERQLSTNKNAEKLIKGE